MQNSNYWKLLNLNFPHLVLLTFSLKAWQRFAFKLLKMLRYWSLKATGASYEQRFGLTYHFTVSHRKTSNFDICLLKFIFTCHFCLIQKIIYYLKRNWPFFSLPKFCCSSIYIITVVTFTQSAFTCWNLTIETLEKSVKYVQS